MKKVLIILAILLFAFLEGFSQDHFPKGKTAIAAFADMKFWSKNTNQFNLAASGIYYVASGIGVGVYTEFYGRNFGNNNPIHRLYLEPIFRHHLSFHDHLFIQPGFGFMISGHFPLGFLFRIGIGYNIPLSQKISLQLQVYHRYNPWHEKFSWSISNIYSQIGISILL